MKLRRWAWLAAMLASSAIAAEGDAISASETALFVTNHLANVRPPTAIRYDVHKSGSLEPGFDDVVKLDLAKDAKSACCSAKAAFVTTPQRQPELQIDTAEGNPVIQYFLEHDIADMHRITGGSTAYFRKLIRLSLASKATLHDTSFDYRGKKVAGREIDITPYVDDPNKARYPTLTAKRYVFLLSDQVPGGVYGIATRVSADKAGLPPLLAEEMMIEGAGRADSTTKQPDTSR